MASRTSKSRIVLAAMTLLALAGASLVNASGGDRREDRGNRNDKQLASRQPHDFSDAYYRAHGINPAALVGRPVGNPPNSTLDPVAPDANHTRVRDLQTSCIWDASGHPNFFTVHGIMFPSTFTNDLAGAAARQIADEYVLYDFPRAANARFATFPKRQEAMADLGHGYFSHDPMGMWRIAHVKFNPATIGTSDGQRRLSDLAARNGTDIDGTPIIKTMSDLNDLRGRNLVTVDFIPSDGSAGPPWFMCFVLEDPRNGAIARDAFLATSNRANGQPNPGEQIFTTTFNSLKNTGDFPH